MRKYTAHTPNAKYIIYKQNFILIRQQRGGERGGDVNKVDSINRDEPDSPLTQYITNAGISRARYTITLFKHHHRVLQLIFNRISV